MKITDCELFRHKRDAANPRCRPQDHPPNPLPQQPGSHPGECDTPWRASALQGAARGADARRGVSRWVVMSLCGFIIDTQFTLRRHFVERPVRWHGLGHVHQNYEEECDSNNPADLLVFLPVMYFRIPTPSGVFYQFPTHRVYIANVYFLYVHDPTFPPFLQTYTSPLSIQTETEHPAALKRLPCFRTHTPAPKVLHVLEIIRRGFAPGEQEASSNKPGG